MRKVTFRITDYAVRADTDIVEIVINGLVCGALYPDDGGLRLISAHLDSDPERLPPDSSDPAIWQFRFKDPLAPPRAAR